MRTATERDAAGEEARDVELIELERPARRPSGTRFGALVHAVLATVRLDAGREGVEQAVSLQGRILGATADEAAAAIDAVESTLAHPLMKRARSALEKGRCRRETPVTLREGDTLIEGVVDLAFEEDGRWLVVDFKTDRELADRLVEYRRQVGLYAAAISAATGKDAAAILLQV